MVTAQAARSISSGECRLRGEGLLSFGLPVPGEEFRQTGLRQLCDAIEDVGKPGLRVCNRL